MGMGGGTSCGIGESGMTRPTLQRVQRTIGPDEPLPPMPVRPMLGPEDFAAYLAERAKKSRLCPVDRTSGLDGFLTAILIGPKFLDPRDWIASISGEAALSAPETTREHLAIQAIVAHHNRISTTLSEAPNDYRPLFDRDPRLGIETTWWLVGFARGRDLASRAWGAVRDTQSQACRLHDELGDALCASPAPDDVAEKVAGSIIGLRNFFRDKRSRSQRRKR
jgi:uncharacterized protein